MQLTNKIKNLFGRTKGFGLFQSITLRGANWNGNFLKANEISLYTNAAIRKRAEKVSQIEFFIKRGDKIITEDPILDLLNKPNKIFSGVQFWKLYQTYRDIFGEAYIYIKKSTDSTFIDRKIELHLLNPSEVEPVFDEATMDYKHFKYKPQNKTEQILQPQEVIRIYTPNPSDQLKAFSLLKAGADAISTDIQLAKYQSNVLKNGGRIEGLFKFKQDNLTQEQLKEAKDEYYKEYSNSVKSGKPLFMGGDAEYIELGLKPNELAYLESKKMTLNDVCIMTSVPKAILASLGDETFANADASIRIFLKETIKPLMDELTNGINTSEILSKEGTKICYVDPTPENIDVKLKKLETANAVNALTTNEKREELGYEPVKEGDKILIPFSLTELTGDEKEEEPELEEEKKEQGGIRLKSKKKSEFKHPLRDKEFRVKYWELFIKKADKREDQFKKIINRYFRGQEQRITEDLADQQIKRKDIIDETFNIELETRIAVEAFLPFLQKVLIESGIDTMDLVGSQYEFFLSGEIASWLDKKVNIFTREINETTFKQLKIAFTESLGLGENRDQLVKRIKGVYGDISDKRAATIARTEVLGANQKGNFEGYQQSGLETKIWVAVNDSRTRDSHAILDGAEVPINQPFTNGLQYPGDPSGGAGEVINCRCTI